MKDWAGVLAKQQRDCVLLLLNLFFKLGHLGSCGVQQLLRLAHVGQGYRTSAFQPFGQGQGISASLDCFPRDLKLGIERAELQIRGRDLIDKRQTNRPLRPRLRQ